MTKAERQASGLGKGLGPGVSKAAGRSLLCPCPQAAAHLLTVTTAERVLRARTEAVPGGGALGSAAWACSLGVGHLSHLDSGGTAFCPQNRRRHWLPPLRQGFKKPFGRTSARPEGPSSRFSWREAVIATPQLRRGRVSPRIPEHVWGLGTRRAGAAEREGRCRVVLSGMRTGGGWRSLHPTRRARGRGEAPRDQGRAWMAPAGGKAAAGCLLLRAHFRRFPAGGAPEGGLQPPPLQSARLRSAAGSPRGLLSALGEW
ncbi:uncharacterized protein LOC123822428 [Phyllostomus hastatus]|uniref:uncharacterized protein LOC123822428 n=1 Tax=Phyllostomus hastatus TaxID=9423 RepID=UPI001E67EFFA|nr:uncharacterized protein LOC123822428 [Phyllostomus hastatus]